MIYKQRNKPYELEVLEYLDVRMHLSSRDKQYYYSFKKGYEGERVFDSLTEKLQCECFILNDLLLNSNNTTFQIDTLMITSETIYLFEVKNLEGDYFYDDVSGKFYKIFKNSQSEIANPLHQLGRKESLFRKLIFKHGYTLPISASVVFTNSGFTLYQAPLNKPMIYPNQIKRYLNKLNKIPLKLNKRHKMLAETLNSLHIHKKDHENLPPYQYDQLQKGITCPECNSFSVIVEGAKCVCHKCGYAEKVTQAVIRSVQEYKLLFPDQKITTNAIHDWCQVIYSKKRVKRILDERYKKVGGSRWVYYE